MAGAVARGLSHLSALLFPRSSLAREHAMPEMALASPHSSARMASTAQPDMRPRCAKAGETMPKTVEFLFDFVSPSSYLAYMALPRIADRAGARVVWTPVHLRGIRESIDGPSPAMIAARTRWMVEDAARWAGHYGIPFQQNSAFPVNTLPILLGAVAFMDDPLIRPYCEVMFKAIWADDRNLSQKAELDSVLDTLGMDPEIFHERIADPAIEARLRENTENAVARGVFGVPTFLVGQSMHFGQDRLWMVAEDLGVPPVEAFEIALGGREAEPAEL